MHLFIQPLHAHRALTPQCSRAVEKSMKNCTAEEGTGEEKAEEEEEEEEEKRMRPLFTLRDGLSSAGRPSDARVSP